jgi:hypothetical protein
MTRTPAQFAERTVAWLLLASAVLGLAVALAAMLVHRAVPASPGAGFWVAALGVLSGGLALRRSTMGVCGGLA